MSQHNPSSADAVYVDHLVTQIHANLSLLLTQGKISNPSVALIKNELPALSSDAFVRSRASAFTDNPTGPVTPSVAEPTANHPTPSSTHASETHPSAPQLARGDNERFKTARALWSYSGSAPDDLSFNKGDRITILAEENADWWKGEVVGSQGRAGLFPSNHVEIIPPRSEPAPTQPPPGHYSSGPNAGPPSSIQGHPSSQYTSSGPFHHSHPQPYAQASNWQAPSYPHGPYQADVKPPPMSGPMPAPPLEHSHSAPPTQIVVEKPKKKPFQGRFGQALVGGAGFGAGSAVASHVVNAIL